MSSMQYVQHPRSAARFSDFSTVLPIPSHHENISIKVAKNKIRCFSLYPYNEMNKYANFH